MTHPKRSLACDVQYSTLCCGLRKRLPLNAVGLLLAVLWTQSVAAFTWSPGPDDIVQPVPTPLQGMSPQPGCQTGSSSASRMAQDAQDVAKMMDLSAMLESWWFAWLE